MQSRWTWSSRRRSIRRRAISARRGRRRRPSITENGCGAASADGIVYGSDRTMFQRSWLTQLQRATPGAIAVLETLRLLPDRYQRGAGSRQNHCASKRGKS
jgi:hypothetical protein